MPLSVIALICYVVFFILFLIAWLMSDNKFMGRPAIVFGLIMVGFCTMMALTMHNVKEYKDQTITTRRTTTVEQICRTFRPAWYVHTCRQQIYADNVALANLKVVSKGTRVFLNGANYFQWNV